MLIANGFGSHIIPLIYALLAGTVIGPVRLNCSTLADDPGGWSKAKWGMTEAQLADAFGPANIVRIPLADAATAPGVDIDLAGVPFRAVFALDKNGKLTHVSLSPRQHKDADEFLFARIEDLLVQKYGRPWKSEAGHSTKFQWSLPATTITLTFFQDRQLDFYMLDLNYSIRAADPL